MCGDRLRERRGEQEEKGDRDSLPPCFLLKLGCGVMCGVNLLFCHIFI